MEEKTIVVNGKKVRFLEEGEGKPLILLHALYVSSDVYLPHFPFLTPHFHIIAPDLPAFGGSEPFDGNHNLDAYSKFLFAFVRTLGLSKVNVFGSSFGGAIALRFGEQYLSWCEKIACEGPAFFCKNLHLSWADKTLYPVLKFLPFGPNILKFFATKRRFLRFNQRVIPERKQQIQDVGEDLVLSDLKKTSPRAMKEIAQDVCSINIEDDLYKLNLPVLIIVGENDTFTSIADARKLHGLLRQGKLAIVPKASHGLTVHKVEEVCELLVKFFGEK